MLKPSFPEEKITLVKFSINFLNFCSGVLRKKNWKHFTLANKQTPKTFFWKRTNSGLAPSMLLVYKSCFDLHKIYYLKKIFYQLGVFIFNIRPFIFNVNGLLEKILRPNFLNLKFFDYFIKMFVVIQFYIKLNE